MKTSFRLFLAAGIGVCLALAVLVSPFADPDPDGLERVASDKGFIDSARKHSLSDSPVAGYAADGVNDRRLATALSGLVGVLLTFGAGVGLFAFLRARRAPQTTERGSKR